ncbi:hypothetical protein PHOSAC3_120222 [Mesotoga infera]|nr:hypothetical protein PHOSAC3_120222 [Mesotoga infera]
MTQNCDKLVSLNIILSFLISGPSGFYIGQTRYVIKGCLSGSLNP